MTVVAGLVAGAHAQQPTDPELSVAQRRLLQQQEVQRRIALEQDPSLRYAPAAVKSACGNGDFETGPDPDSVDPAEWEGGNGEVLPNGDPDFAHFTAGLFPGPLNSANAHQTRIAAGIDPTVGISTVAPSAGSTHSVRIGNAVSGNRSELLSKTFVVTPQASVIRFWYAVVLEDPNHQTFQKPSFWVRVLDSNGAVITRAADLGNGSDQVVADRNNPFFQVAAGGGIVYRDWSCAEIDLGQHIGETVTVQFVTEDCTQGAHFGYAYVDNFCGICDDATTGTVAYDPATSTSCGRGQLCFDFTLPIAGATVGTVTMKLDILQNGNVITTLNGQANGSQYCFPVDPSSIPGLDTNAGSFDFIATAQFAIGGTVLASKTVNSVVDKIPPYKIVCDSVGCCTGPNLVTNGSFESGVTGFSSTYAASPATGPVGPGHYAVVDSVQASAISSSWSVKDPASCSTTGKVLAVNGATGLSGSHTVWSEAIPVVPGRQYRFCANFRNLPQCGFDVKPKIDLRFNSPVDVATSVVINTNPADPCNWVQESRVITIPNGVVLLNAEIVLDETGVGDGNDLAIDDISLQEMTPADPKFMLINIASSNLTTTTYNLTASPVNGQPLSFFWEVCEVDAAGNCLAATQVVNPSQWFVGGANAFPGYHGLNTLLPISSGPGVFEVGKKYKIRYGVFGFCTTFTSSSWYLGYTLSSRKLIVASSVQGLDLQ